MIGGGINFEVINHLGADRLTSPFDKEVHQFADKETNIADGASESGKPATTFGEALSNMIKDVNQSQVQANHAAQEIAAGRKKDIQGAVLSMEKADIQFRLLTQVRNKVIDAYREIMRMQV